MTRGVGLNFYLGYEINSQVQLIRLDFVFFEHTKLIKTVKVTIYNFIMISKQLLQCLDIPNVNMRF